MKAELHIASLVVHANPERLDDVSRCIGGIAGASVHAAAPNGKLVVTLEAQGADGILSAVNAIQRAEGVLSAALVVQYADSLEAMMEEVHDDH